METNAVVEPSVAEQPATVRMKLLYVSGNQSGAEHFVDAFNGQYDVTKVENGMEAFRLIQEGYTPQMILVNQQLRGMSGLEFVKAAKEWAHLSLVPKVLLLEKKQETILDKARQEGVDEVFFVDDASVITDMEYRLNWLVRIKEEMANGSEGTDHKSYKVPLAKRVFDIVVSGAILLCISPIIAIVALLVRLESKGPVFYYSKRVGTGYQIFNFYKIRSMYVDAEERLKDLKHLNLYSQEGEEEDGEILADDCPKCKSLGKLCSPLIYLDGGGSVCENYYNYAKVKGESKFLKIKDDPRITKVGKIIRNTSIDELPQLWNVFVGDMSLVGNRPLPLYEAEMLTTDEWTNRFLGPAGITGLWQVKKRGKGDMSEEERIQLDNEYAANCSFWGDIKILLMTVPALLQKENV